MDPVTASLLASLAGSMIGGKQLGQAAPGHNTQAGGGFDPLSLDNPFGQQGAIQQLGNMGIGGLLGSAPLDSLIGKPEGRGESLAPQVTAQDGGGFDTGAFGQTQDFQNPVDPGVLDSLQQPGNETGFGGFFGNLDQNMQSPSKMLGLGLLSQIDPRLASGGLLAGGLFGKNKLF